MKKDGTVSVIIQKRSEIKGLKGEGSPHCLEIEKRVIKLLETLTLYTLPVKM